MWQSQGSSNHSRHEMERRSNSGQYTCKPVIYFLQLVQSVTQEKPEEETDEYASSPHCPRFTQLSIPDQEMVLPTIMMTLPTLINWQPFTDISWCISQVTLEPVKLSTNGHPHTLRHENEQDRPTDNHPADLYRQNVERCPGQRVQNVWTHWWSKSNN